MAAGADPERQVLLREGRPGDDAPARDPAGLRRELGGERRGKARWRRGEVDLVPPQRPERVGRVVRRQGEDEPVEVGRVRPPVAGVPDQDEPPAGLEPADEEGAVADRPAGLRIVDPVTPDRRDVLAGQRVARQDEVEEAPPVGERLPQLDHERLRTELAEAADLRVELAGALLRGRLPGGERAVGELEVGRADLHAVVPARLRPDVVGERERLFADRHPRDEVRPEDEIRTDLEGALEHLREHRIEMRDVARAERVQAGERRARGHDGSAALRRRSAGD